MKKIGDQFDDLRSHAQDEDKSKSNQLIHSYGGANTRYVQSIRERLPTHIGAPATVVKSSTRKAPLTLDIRSKSYQNKQSLYSTVTKTTNGQQPTPIRNGFNKNKEKKADDIFSKGPDRRVVNEATAANN